MKNKIFFSCIACFGFLECVCMEKIEDKVCKMSVATDVREKNEHRCEVFEKANQEDKSARTAEFLEKKRNMFLEKTEETDENNFITEGENEYEKLCSYILKILKECDDHLHGANDKRSVISEKSQKIKEYCNKNCKKWWLSGALCTRDTVINTLRRISNLEISLHRAMSCDTQTPRDDKKKLLKLLKRGYRTKEEMQKDFEKGKNNRNDFFLYGFYEEKIGNLKKKKDNSNNFFFREWLSNIAWTYIFGKSSETEIQEMEKTLSMQIAEGAKDDERFENLIDKLISWK